MDRPSFSPLQNHRADLAVCTISRHYSTINPFRYIKGTIMAEESTPQEARTVPFQTASGNIVDVQQPQRGRPANRVIPPTSAGVGGYHPDSAGPSAAHEEATGKFTVNWYPTRGPGVDAYVELDACFIRGLPSNPEAETDPVSRMVIALLTEVVTLRARVERLEPKDEAAPAATTQ